MISKIYLIKFYFVIFFLFFSRKKVKSRTRAK
uniref:Photosystem II protein T n=1 Tax=Adiantum tricholepis TaxID=1803730 RepID=A0A3G5CQ78_9MONI|nr:photosystem II protein T [Adiantum tricholepis]AYW15006.1 photosystem II protein T [Adiantum tricholepis]